MIQKFHDESGRPKWCCCHCQGEWYEYNATKALGHVTGIVKDIKACSGMIGSRYKESYLDLHRSKFSKTVEKQHCITSSTQASTRLIQTLVQVMQHKAK